MWLRVKRNDPSSYAQINIYLNYFCAFLGKELGKGALTKLLTLLITQWLTIYQQFRPQSKFAHLRRQQSTYILYTHLRMQNSKSSNSFNSRHIKPSPITLTFFFIQKQTTYFFVRLYKMSPEMKLSVNKVFINIYYSNKKCICFCYAVMLLEMVSVSYK